jgi:predicted PurR-regulated permease PerM
MSGGTTNGWLSRERVAALVLILASGVVFYLCYRLVLPFLPALAWALALAVIAHPIHRRMKSWCPRPNLAAGLSVVVVAVIIVVPVIFITHRLVYEADKYTQTVQNQLTSGKWRSALEKRSRLKSLIPWIESQLGLQSSHPNTTAIDETANSKDKAAVSQNQSVPGSSNQVERSKEPDATVIEGVGAVVTGTIWLGMQLFITFLSLFFFFRDRELVLAALRSLMPLSNAETDEVFSRVDDTIHVTIYGSLVVALVQGTMGGLMFWWLGLPAPLFWGAVMGLLAVVPVLGTFVIWAPTAAYLAMRGNLQSALILTAWGGIAIALVDNLLYPFLVGRRLRFHTLLVFFAMAGGLALFGASGVILGPLLLATADALLHVWKRRTAFGGTIEAGVQTT